MFVIEDKYHDGVTVVDCIHNSTVNFTTHNINNISTITTV